MTLNYLKAMIAGLSLICITVLLAVHAVAGEVGVPIITMVVGYAIGNGIASSTGQVVEPIIKLKDVPK